MTFKITENRNNRKIIKRISRHRVATEQGIRMGMMDTGQMLVKTGRGLIRKGPKTGRLYRIPGRRRRHRASSPGEAPANRTGMLARSQGFKVSGFSEMAYGERAEYAPFLELGTKKMDARPHLITSIELNTTNARRNFERRIRQELIR